ncbi:hypothetical protein [Desulfotalea psychrophila]|uniref:Uncharacterized protein n=1 Tax=Desulfotalea psychrophila (strain LSv54 / DSM 12343) TaxID=177439 RepID=Q6AL65_DESPS|nr:hypothetical protein [Desulfotalea psychrophila]CAG36910.1 unknown protein [Desulfotalea psychrophila LSv54]
MEEQTKQTGSTFKKIGVAAIISLAIICAIVWYFSRETATSLQESSPLKAVATDIKTEATDQADTVESSVLLAPDNIETIAGENISLPEQVEIAEKQQAKPEALTIYQATSQLNTFFSQLDKETYIEKRQLSQGSKAHFSKLLQDIVDNPPVITGESDDLFTLLQNTAHFYRVLGGKNISLIKEVLDKENNQVESVAADLYLILQQPDTLKEQYGVSLPPTALYDYGCFFLNTLGGRLYMFRRDLDLRTILSYYALFFVHQAEEKGLNRHGIDIRPFLEKTIKELETHGQNIQRRDYYLENLYMLEKNLEQ